MIRYVSVISDTSIETNSNIASNVTIRSPLFWSIEPPKEGSITAYRLG